MKRFLLAFAAICTSLSSVFAWSGGPFSQDTSLSNGADGTHTAIMRGKNFLGVMVFPIGLSATGVGGAFSYNLEGNLVKGEVLATANTVNREIAGVMDGFLPGTSVIVTNTTIVDGNLVRTTEVVDLPGQSVAGDFEASITQTFPSMLWEGTGTVGEVQVVDENGELGKTLGPVDFAISGIRTSLTLPPLISPDPFVSFVDTGVSQSTGILF